MRARFNPLRFAGLCALLAGLLLWTGCDSSDDDGFTEEDLAGTYTMTQLAFETDGSGVLDVDVLDDLGQTLTMRFFAGSSDRFELTRAGAPNIPGEYEVDGDQVELNFDDSFRSEWSALLIPDGLRLNIVQNGTVLERDLRRSGVDLEEYDQDVFDGLGDVSGTLRVRLQR